LSQKNFLKISKDEKSDQFIQGSKIGIEKNKKNQDFSHTRVCVREKAKKWLKLIFFV
jgi:hypothetical protein